MTEETALGGMTAIRDFCRSINLQCSEATIISMIKECGFPARKLRGQWTSDKALIKKWHVGFISETIPLADEGHNHISSSEKNAKKRRQEISQ